MILQIKKIIKKILYYCIWITFRIFPIKKNRIMFSSFNGKAFNCNPMYLFKYLRDIYGDNLEYIWHLDDLSKYNDLHDSSIKFVYKSKIHLMYYMMTSYVIIYNNAEIAPIPVRSNQIRINTWHGGGCYKRITNVDKNGNRIKADMSHTTHFISSCRMFSEVELKAEFNFYGQILPIGLPRNDVLFNAEMYDKCKKKIQSYYGLAPDKAIILYAPTWRDNKKYSFEYPNFNNLIESYENRFGLEAIILVRSHHAAELSIHCENCIDVTQYPDSQHLLLASDLLISDYSSIVWDYSFSKKPCFIYAPDLINYENNHGFIINIREWGFSISMNSDELCKNIEFFNENEFRNKMNEHHNLLGSYETGQACKKVTELLNLSKFKEKIL